MTALSDRRVRSGVALVGVMVLLACERNARTAGEPAAASPAALATHDTARGVVRRVGNEPGDVLVLERSPGDVLALAGDQAAAMRGVEGLEVAVTGRLTTERLTPASPRPIRVFEVVRFVVRASDGRPAHDGTLVERGGNYFLRETDGGEQRIGAPPAALRAHTGARVWIIGPLGGSPQTFGVIHH